MRKNSRVLVSAFALLGMLLAAGAFWSCRAQGDSKVGVSGNFNSGNVKFIVQAPDVRDFDLSVGASLSIEGAYVSRGSASFDIGTGAVVNATSVSAGKLEIDCSTGAVANISGIKADKVELDCSTGAVANLSGRSNYFSADCSTGAVVDASRLEAGSGKVDAGTGAQVEVNIRNLKSVEKSHGASVTNHAR